LAEVIIIIIIIMLRHIRTVNVIILVENYTNTHPPLLSKYKQKAAGVHSRTASYFTTLY